MNPFLQQNLEKLHADQREIQSQAFTDLVQASEVPVDWAYEAWDTLVADLRHPDNLIRAVAAQVLCNLVKSDPEQRILKDFPTLLVVTKDERFVTARHCMQALWKVGVAGEAQKEMLVKGLAGRFAECVSEKNCTLIRYDILQALQKVYDVVKDESIRQKALELIETEPDLKYRKKYTNLWKTKAKKIA
jgi:hypothetical protein